MVDANLEQDVPDVPESPLFSLRKTRRGQKPGPKPELPNGRRLSAARRNILAEYRRPKPDTARCKRDEVPPKIKETRVRPILQPQAGRLPRVPIALLPDIPNNITIDEDKITWIICLLPAEFQTRRNAMRFVRHLVNLPQITYDDELSLPLARMANFVADRTLNSTLLAARLGWRITDHLSLWDKIRRHINEVCEARADIAVADSPTHATRLGRSAVSNEIMRRPRHPSPGDQKPQTHRRRANRQQDFLVAVIDQACAVPGVDAPMVSDRVVHRFVYKAMSFLLGAGDRSLISVPADEATSEGWNGHPVDGVHYANVSRAVRRFGPDGVRKRATKPALARAVKNKADFEDRRAFVLNLRAEAAKYRKSYIPLSMRFSLRGCYYNICRDLPFTIDDGANLLRRIVRLVIGDYNGVSLLDASDQGHPHVHLVVLVPTARRPELYDRIVGAYEHVGINARGSVLLDSSRGSRQAYLVTARRLSVDAADYGWTYAVDKTEPISTLVDRKGEPRLKDRRIRFAAWRQVHGVRDVWRQYGVSVASNDEVFDVAPDEAVSDGPISDSLVSDSLVSDSLVSDSLVSDSLVSDGPVSDSLVSDSLVSDGSALRQKSHRMFPLAGPGAADLLDRAIDAEGVRNRKRRG